MASRAAKKKRLLAQGEEKAMTRQTQQAKPLTMIDLQGAYTKGYEAGFEKGRETGFKQASTHTVECLFGAVVIAAHSLYGFGQERCIRLLNKVYETTLETLSTKELADRAFDEVGIEIDWTEPVEVAQPREPARKRGKSA